VNVTSTRGEPLRASVSVHTEPGEQVAPECLSLGDERDAPDPELPLIRSARFALSPTGDSILFTTSEPVNVPAVAVVLRVQCPGQPLYARLLNLHLKPAPVARTSPAPKPAPAVPGANLTVKGGDTLYSIARTIFPQNGETVQDLVRAIVLANPALFPDQRSRPLKVGETLRIPDLRLVQQIVKNPPPKPKPVQAAPAPAAPVAAATPVPASAKSPAPPPAAAAAPPAPAKPALRAPRPAALSLRLAGDLDVRRLNADPALRAELRRQFSGEAPPRRVTVAAPTDAASEALELKAERLRETQGLIDQQIGKLEQAVAALSQSVLTAAQQPPPRPAPQPAPQPVKPPPPQIIVRDEMPWWVLPGFAGVALIAAALAFLLGRRGRREAPIDEHEARIDRLLEEARAAAGPLLGPGHAPARYDAPPAEQQTQRMERPSLPSPKPAAAPARPAAAAPGKPEADETDPALSTQPDASAGVDLELESGSPPAEESDAIGVSTNLRQEMDLALDNTRSMFTDVDRFIALGRTQNAISLLEFQVQKDQQDRDSWIKLLAVYRQENMDTEFEKAHRTFIRLFPGEK
jgi:hypothetical protein